MILRRLCRLALLAVGLALPAQAQVLPRLVRITQVDAAGTMLGQGIEVFCPTSGCEETLSVTFEDAPEILRANIEVVLRGIYLALNPRNVGTLAVVDFDTGRPGATFVQTRGRERVVSTLRFNLVRDGSVRALRGFDPTRKLSEGDVFNRARVPDFYLRVEVLVTEGN